MIYVFDYDLNFRIFKEKGNDIYHFMCTKLNLALYRNNNL